MKRIIGIALLGLVMVQCKTSGGSSTSSNSQKASTATNNSNETATAPTTPAEAASNIQAASSTYASSDYCTSNPTDPSCTIAQSVAAAPAATVATTMGGTPTENGGVDPGDVQSVQDTIAQAPAPTSSSTSPTTNTPGYTAEQIAGITLMSVGGVVVVGGLGAAAYHKYSVALASSKKDSQPENALSHSSNKPTPSVKAPKKSLSARFADVDIKIGQEYGKGVGAAIIGVGVLLTGGMLYGEGGNKSAPATTPALGLVGTSNGCPGSNPTTVYVCSLGQICISQGLCHP